MSPQTPHSPTTTTYLKIMMKKKTFHWPQDDSNLQQKKKTFLWMEEKSITLGQQATKSQWI